MLALINPAALPALRIAATFFLILNIVAFVFILTLKAVLSSRGRRSGRSGKDQSISLK
jgi:hypothetical protein